MFANSIKVAIRNLRRHAGFTFLNITGLTLGLTACLLIGLFVRDELQYDRFLPEGDRVYRVYSFRTDNEGSENLAVIPPTVATTLTQQFPEVEQAMRILMYSGKSLLEAGDRKIYEDQGLIADSNFFSIFPLPFRYGASSGSLDGPASVVLSVSMAEQLFGKENPVGKSILIDKEPFQVTGVFDIGREKFHLKPRYVIPMRAAQLPADRMESWGWQQFYTYFKLKKGAGAGSLEKKLDDYIRKSVNPVLEARDRISFRLHFQPLDKVHLYSSSFKYDLAIRGNITYVRALSIIAGFILLIACFNFVNLATAKSLQRAREVGVRKTIGASRAQLIFQFLSETVLLTTISLLVSLAITWAILPWLNAFTGKSIPFDLVTNPLLFLLLLLLSVVVGVLAGFYPALVLSGFVPVKVLKGSAAGATRPGAIPWLRHSLVVVQFSLSVLLIISALVVIRQVNYLHQKNLGFQKDQILFFPMRGENLTNNYETFKNELTKVPGVASVSIGYGFPGDAVAGDNILVPGRGDNKSFYATQLAVDHDYIETLGLQMVAGRGFSKAVTTDKDHAFVINETAVRELGFGTPEKAIGQTLHWEVWESVTPDSLKTGQVIGVVKDFH
ncbi:MAG TPA: ABC transporter permease, partial [Chitinophagaceae bacterium]|nr:ABC transporter permease [Chitinophagaceae bacterium]